MERNDTVAWKDKYDGFRRSKMEASSNSITKRKENGETINSNVLRKVLKQACTLLRSGTFW